MRLEVKVARSLLQQTSDRGIAVAIAQARVLCFAQPILRD